MLDAQLIRSLPRLPSPVLTVYLNTNPSKPRNQGWPSGARIWLKSAAKQIENDLAAEALPLFRKQVTRVDKFLRSHPRGARGIVLFSGPATWHVLKLQLDVEDELRYGQASLRQLLWLLDEYQPCGVCSVDRTAARFYRFWMGEFQEEEVTRFEFDTSSWRQKSAVRPARLGQRKTGVRSERDAFERRIKAQYGKLFKETAKAVDEWVQRSDLNPIFLIGPAEILESIRKNTSPITRARMSLVKGDYGRLSLPELRTKIEPLIIKWKRVRESDDVASLIGNKDRSRAVVGITETLAELQRGRARALIMSRALRGRVRECVNCGWTDRAADRTCRVCGGRRKAVGLQEALPELVRKFSVPVEVVAGKASADLKKVGGLGAWLR